MATPFILPAALTAISALSKFFEKKPKSQKFDSFSGPQGELQDSVIQQIMQSLGNKNSPYGQSQSYLSNLFSNDPEAFSQFEQPYKDQYQQEVVPQLAERFSGLGAQKSSAFNQTLARSGQDLTTKLASLRSGLQMQALPYAQNSLNNLMPFAMQNRYSTGISPRQPGWLSDLISPIAGGLSQGFGNQFGQNTANSLFGA